MTTSLHPGRTNPSPKPGVETTASSPSYPIVRRIIIPVVTSIFIAGLMAFFSSARISSSLSSILSHSPFSTGPVNIAANLTRTMSTTTRSPVYFLGHGGPPLMFEPNHPAFKRLQTVGKEITQQVKPRAVIAISAHGQASRDAIEVNTAGTTDLIYDFYNFPSHFYKQKFPNVGDKVIAENVISTINKAGLKATGVERGLDHGIWVPFKIAFDAESNPLDVPIISVSLHAHEDADAHYKLGQALSSLRDDNIAIIASGMVVHNLRDYMTFYRTGGAFRKDSPYCQNFDDAVKEAVETAVTGDNSDARMKAMAQLLTRPDARSANPSFEHLLPLHVAAGAAGADLGKRLWTLHEAGMSYAQFRFGEVPSSS